MSQFRLGIIICGLLAVTISQAQTAQTPTPASGVLTAAELRGKEIYQRGKSVSGHEIVAIASNLELPSESMTCAGCHGSRGEGKIEGGVSSGSLTWSSLTNSTGHTHSSGRKHRPFNEKSVAAATLTCIDPDGHKLMAAMPCYRMSPQDMTDLVAYLKRIETDVSPGITQTTITIGAIIPTQGPLAEVGAAMRDMLIAYSEELNRQGGIYQRKIAWQFADMVTEPAITTANVKRLVESGQVFALVGGLSAGLDKELVAIAQAQQIPIVGPSTLSTAITANDYIFYLLPGVGEQASALVNFAVTKPELKTTKLLLVLPENELARIAAASVEAQAKIVGWSSVSKHSYGQGTFNAAQLVESLKKENSNVLFFFGSGAEVAALIKEAGAAGWSPNIFLLSTVGSEAFASAPSSFQGKAFFSFPSVPTDITVEGAAEFRALREKYKLPVRHTASQLSALGAAKVFVEGLKLAGKDLSRDKLVTAFESLTNFETGVTPRITFGPKQRIGARGAYIVSLDLEKKTFLPSTVWIKAN